MDVLMDSRNSVRNFVKNKIIPNIFRFSYHPISTHPFPGFTLNFLMIENFTVLRNKRKKIGLYEF